MFVTSVVDGKPFQPSLVFARVFYSRRVRACLCYAITLTTKQPNLKLKTTFRFSLISFRAPRYRQSLTESSKRQILWMKTRALSTMDSLLLIIGNSRNPSVVTRLAPRYSA